MFAAAAVDGAEAGVAGGEAHDHVDRGLIADFTEDQAIGLSAHRGYRRRACSSANKTAIRDPGGREVTVFFAPRDRLTQNYGGHLQGQTTRYAESINRDATAKTPRSVNEVGVPLPCNRPNSPTSRRRLSSPRKVSRRFEPDRSLRATVAAIIEKRLLEQSLSAGVRHQSVADVMDTNISLGRPEQRAGRSNSRARSPREN